MAMLSAMVNTLACFYPRVQQSTEEEFDDEAAWLLSKARTIAAYSYRRSLGLPFIYPDPGLCYAGNFLHMMFSMPFDQHVPSPEVVGRSNLVLILHADHELGCSTTTVRIVGSSRANLFASCAAGICSLWGPVHGGATIAVVEMLEQIYRGDLSIDQAIRQAREKTERLPPQGLRPPDLQELRPAGPDPQADRPGPARPQGRARPAARHRPGARGKALEDPYFVDHRLFPNADFYNGIAMRAIGIPRNMFTVIFAHRADARLDRPLEGAIQRPRRPDRPAEAGLHGPDRD